MTDERVERVEKAIEEFIYGLDHRFCTEDDDIHFLARAAIESLSITEGEVEGRELLATVDMIETRPIGWPFSDEQTDPIWRIELDGYCADFEHSEAANNFALAINSRIEKALSLPSTVRGEVIEECAKVAEADHTPGYGPHRADMESLADTQRRDIADAIRALKGKPTPEGEG